MRVVAFIVYRKWAYDIYLSIKRKGFFEKLNIKTILVTTKESEFNYTGSDLLIVENKNMNQIDEVLSSKGVSVVFFYGWSWIVTEPILSKYICVCLHPSPLPKYRGGSPIQHQIIAGESVSAVSLFVMKHGIDDGDILKQKEISLQGSLREIFLRITETGVMLTENFLQDFVNGQVKVFPQNDLEKNPPYKRRTKTESVFMCEDVAKMSYMQVFNLVRALDDPYPNFQIIFSNGSFLVRKIEYVKSDKNLRILNEDSFFKNNSSYGFRVVDGFVKITEGDFLKK
jgi:methionyl-tRNA formyltransferase